MMMTTQSKLKKRSENSLKTDKKLTKTLVIGSFVATFIALTPFFYSLHESVPEQRVWDTFLFTYNSNFWEDANYAMWVLTQKIVPLSLFFVWFFTCRHWWYHALLVPIALYTFQIFSTLNAESNYLDEFQIVYILPIMAVIVPSIYLIRAKMFNKLNENKSLEELEDEFTMRPKGIFGKIKDYF